MRLPPFNSNIKIINRSEYTARPITESGGSIWYYMKAKNSINFRIIQNTFFYHKSCTPFFAIRITIFSRLKNELYSS